MTLCDQAFFCLSNFVSAGMRCIEAIVTKTSHWSLIKNQSFITHPEMNAVIAMHISYPQHMAGHWTYVKGNPDTKVAKQRCKGFCRNAHWSFLSWPRSWTLHSLSFKVMKLLSPESDSGYCVSPEAFKLKVHFEVKCGESVTGVWTSFLLLYQLRFIPLHRTEIGFCSQWIQQQVRKEDWLNNNTRQGGPIYRAFLRNLKRDNVCPGFCHSYKVWWL